MFPKSYVHPIEWCLVLLSICRNRHAMKKCFASPVLMLVLLCVSSAFAEAQVLDKTEGVVKGLFKKKSKPSSGDAAASSSAGNGTAGAGVGAGAGGDAGSAAPVSLKTYANYDFVPGDQIIFEDNFADDADGEFPAHWNLEKGQAIINKIGGVPAFCLTEGNYAEVSQKGS